MKLEKYALTAEITGGVAVVFSLVNDCYGTVHDSCVAAVELSLD